MTSTHSVADEQGHGVSPHGRRLGWVILCGAALCAWGPISAEAQPPADRLPSPLPGQGPAPQVLSIDAAVAWALQQNPELAALRQQRGVAAAGVVIARTYPHNPVAQSTILSVKGADPAADLRPISQQYQITWEVELRGQRAFRKQAAFAALSRADWEIASQEVTFAANVIRAYDNLLYRQAKSAITEEFLRLNQRGAEQVKQLAELGTLRASDLILARAEVSDIQAQIGLNRIALLSAQRDLLRAIGISEGRFLLQGMLERSVPSVEAEGLLEMALEHRPDLFARRVAVDEAEARVRLQVADRFGNVNVGPVFDYDESRTRFIGAQIAVPIPVFNHRNGEIQQLQALRTQAIINLQQTDIEIRREVPFSLARLVEARAWVENYQKQILPDLRRSLNEIERLFQQGQGGADTLRVLDVRRKLLRAQDGYLDALLGHNQALVELAIAVGDPALAMGIYQDGGARP